VVRKEMKNVECPPVHSFHAFEVVHFSVPGGWLRDSCSSHPRFLGLINCTQNNAER
jgi:hypothetical protein